MKNKATEIIKETWKEKEERKAKENSKWKDNINTKQTVKRYSIKGRERNKKKKTSSLKRNEYI